MVFESLQVRLQDITLDEKTDLHKFAPCKYVSKMYYLKQIFSSVHFLIEVQWLGTNCQMKHVRWGILLALNSPYLRI